jgi:hypothetical protein
VKVSHGFVSFTEVTRPAEHRAYNEWHLFDHLPEQLPLTGIVWGQRWVLTPALRVHAVALPPLDRVHYMTLYLLAEPIAETLGEFRELGARLRAEDRFHQHRVSHLSGPFVLRSTWAAPRVLVSPEAVPYRPNTGVHVSVTRAPVTSDHAPQVAGVWQFADDLRWLKVSWLDGDVASAVQSLSAPPDTELSGVFQTIDPTHPFDWFD